MGRRLWAAGLILYAGVAALDLADHLARDFDAGGAGRGAALAVGLAASLFWPIDLLGRVLAPRSG